MLKIIPFILLFSFLFSFAGDVYQFDLLGGLGAVKADNSIKFPAQSYALKFQGVSSSDNYFRWLTSFNMLTDGNVTATMVGEFDLGFALYPLGFLPNLPTQPFIGGAGVIMLGTIDSTSQMLFGYDIPSGIDLRLSRVMGFKIQVDYISVGSSIKYFRYGLGLTFYFIMKNG